MGLLQNAPHSRTERVSEFALITLEQTSHQMCVFVRVRFVDMCTPDLIYYTVIRSICVYVGSRIGALAVQRRRRRPRCQPSITHTHIL